MSTASPSTDRWVVSTQVSGEVLTAEACVSTLELRLLGMPDGFSQREAEGWIESLAVSAFEGSGASVPDDPLPPALRQSLGGLLFSCGELWVAKQPLCCMALIREPGRVAFGWIGDASVEIHVAGNRIVPEWISVRDHLGGEARAWSGESREETIVSLSVTAEDGSQVRLTASWPGEGSPEAQTAALADVYEDVEAIEPIEPIEPIELPQVDSFAEVEEAAELVTFAEPEPAEEIEAVGESAATEDMEEVEIPEAVADAEAVEARAQTTRPSHGVARWLERALGEERQAEVEPVAPELPDRIPPSPEPPALTARTVRESVPIEDPRAITLRESLAGAESSSDPVPPLGTGAIQKTQWAATLESLGAREPVGLSPAIRDRIARARGGGGEPEEWEPLKIETLAPTSGWTGAEEAEIPEPPPEPEQPAEEKAADGAAPKRGIPRRPEWPVAPGQERPVAWGRWAFWTAFVLLLFGGGWWVGSFQHGDTVDKKPSGFALFLRQLGLGGARFDARIASFPAGAHIAVDGKDTGLRTPSVLSLTPGPHRVDLSLPNLGAASYRIEGKKGDEVPLEAPLWGSVTIAATDLSIPVAVAVDGQPRGFVPATIDSLAPGPHELRYTGPGMASWGSAIEIRIGEKKEVLAYPLQSPATGLLQVRATVNEEGDRHPFDGAKVWVDGKPRGVTPMTLELSRGPHSVRVVRDKEEAPIQLIDLPGGNQRFATFDFGLTSDFPRIVLRVPAIFPADEPVLVSATVTDASSRDIREMWLHVRSTDGAWRRYEMTVMEASGDAVGAAPFPSPVLASQGSALYYVSALTTQGDEIYTEIQLAESAKVAKKP